METLKIAFLSYMGSAPTPPIAYGGEIIYWNVVDELAKMGHEVTLFAAPGSKTPENGKLIELSSLYGDALVPLIEHQNVLKHINTILKHDVIIDASNFKFAHYYANVTNNADKALVYLISNDFNNILQPHHVVCISEKHRLLCMTLSHSYVREPYPSLPFYAMNSMTNISTPTFVYPDIDLDLYTSCYEKEDYVCWVSRFRPEKGIKQAIEACVKAGVKLKVSGSRWLPDHKIYYETAIAPLLSKYNIEYVETNTRQDLIKFLQKARAFIFDVQYQESFGYVVLESLAVGTPVLTTCLGAMPEIVEHGKSGLIVPNAVSEFASALSRINEIRPEESRKRAEYFRKGKGGRRMYELCKAALDKRWPAQLIPFTDRGLG